jgi:ABC-type Zn2+ transport system substrate-binding protein/surface adhesin
VKALFALLLLALPLSATTISVVPVFEPLSMHGTDVDEGITDTGEALQATVASRPMALTGAMPEILIEAIRTPHKFPTNNPNYKIEEVNLLVLCNIGITAESKDNGLHIALNVSQLIVPEGVDLTGRQVLKLAQVAIRKTLEEYQKPQTEPLIVHVAIEGTNEGTASLTDLGLTFTLGGE